MTGYKNFRMRVNIGTMKLSEISYKCNRRVQKPNNILIHQSNRSIFQTITTHKDMHLMGTSYVIITFLKASIPLKNKSYSY
jgi:hypothetical protein